MSPIAKSLLYSFGLLAIIGFALLYWANPLILRGLGTTLFYCALLFGPLLALLLKKEHLEQWSRGALTLFILALVTTFFFTFRGDSVYVVGIYLGIAMNLGVAYILIIYQMYFSQL